jgi:hypothetical protein
MQLSMLRFISVRLCLVSLSKALYLRSKCCDSDKLYEFWYKIVEKLKGSILICYINFSILILDFFFPYSFPVLHVIQ